MYLFWIGLMLKGNQFHCWMGTRAMEYVYCVGWATSGHHIPRLTDCPENIYIILGFGGFYGVPRFCHSSEEGKPRICHSSKESSQTLPNTNYQKKPKRAQIRLYNINVRGGLPDSPVKFEKSPPMWNVFWMVPKPAPKYLTYLIR